MSFSQFLGVDGIYKYSTEREDQAQLSTALLTPNNGPHFDVLNDMKQIALWMTIAALQLHLKRAWPDSFYQPHFINLTEIL